MMHLVDGRVQLVLKTRKKMEISTQAVFIDGIWHKVETTTGPDVIAGAAPFPGTRPTRF